MLFIKELVEIIQIEAILQLIFNKKMDRKLPIFLLKMKIYYLTTSNFLIASPLLVKILTV